jgi:hypothetical protein
MASEVDICNLALGHLGDKATVSSIDPPEGSAQATHCARFYPIARDVTLESHEWGFATVRANLALLTDTPPPGWLYVYAAPNDCRNIIDLIDPNAPCFNPLPESGLHWQDDVYNPEPIAYELESRGDGTGLIYTNLAGAQVRYVRSVTDTTRFSAQFIDAVAWLLAAYLAGPVVKGDTGAAMARQMMSGYMSSLAAAKSNDANNRRRSTAQSQRQASWIANR